MDPWEQIALQLRKVAEGQEDSWERLLLLLSPLLDRFARSQPLGRLRDDPDIQRDVVTKAISRLHAGEHRTIKKLVATEDPPPLEAWFRVLVRSAAIDVMRARPEFIRGNQQRAPGWFSLATLVTQAGVQPVDTLAAKQREVQAFLAQSVEAARRAFEQDSEQAAANLAVLWKVPAIHTRRLLKKVDVYEQVLSMVLAGHAYVEVAEALGRSPREIELVVQYIEELLRVRGFAA